MGSTTQLAIYLLSGYLMTLLSFNASATEEHIIDKIVNLDDVAWGPARGGDGFPIGVRTAQLQIDPSTGGITYYALFPAGSTFDLHWHTHDEFVVVARGVLQIVLGDEAHTVKAGGYIVIPGSVIHQWSVQENAEDAIILVRRAGPADFHFVSPS